MSAVIQLLEALGRQAHTGPVSDAALADAMTGLDLDPALREALQRRDVAALTRLLKGRGNVMLILAPAEPEPKDGNEKEGDAPCEPDEKSAA